MTLSDEAVTLSDESGAIALIVVQFDVLIHCIQFSHKSKVVLSEIDRRLMPVFVSEKAVN